MCGIAAILSRDGPVPAAALRRATAALRHRGPDAERTWVSPSDRVGLGHTLLVITDPQGHQPIARGDGRLHIIVNGQFLRLQADSGGVGSAGAPFSHPLG